MNNLELTIRIGIIGPVSTGKSTFINSLFGKTYSQMKLRRTTMIPQVYHEDTQYVDDDALIRLKNMEPNVTDFVNIIDNKIRD
ncbi:hypothetical protein Catovirus_1_531 [Catovirus CTV1]|uniref:G domain-containing protein n=1 Tax=Catovirus CTV1 TaxID=1977631 RepID=A0A1V0S9W4_9VIRU|nr:hypothetical protein Catovirus_1_531 [Catovirus CTV1]